MNGIKKIMSDLFIFIFSVLALLLLLGTLSSCDNGGDEDMQRKLSVITGNSILVGVEIKENHSSVYDAYLKYFRMNPDEFDAFYKEKTDEINTRGKCYLYAPNITFTAAMPDGENVKFSYNLITHNINAVTSAWDVYRYRYYDFGGIYTEREGGTLLIDSNMQNVSGVACESLVNTDLYIRLKPAAVRVVLNTNGGEWSSGSEFKMELGEDIGTYLNEIPEKTGYRFVGWKFTVGETDGYPLSVIDFTTVQNQSLRIMNEVNFKIVNSCDELGYNMMTNGKYEGRYNTDWYVTLEAQYEQEQYKITYVNFDGSVYKIKTVAAGTVLTQHNTEVLSAYSCKGWSLSEDSENTFNTVTVNGDLTLYPVEARSKTVTLHLSDGVTVVCRVYETYPLDLSSVIPSGIDSWYLDPGHSVPVESHLITYENSADSYYAVLE